MRFPFSFTRNSRRLQGTKVALLAIAFSLFALAAINAPAAFGQTPAANSSSAATLPPVSLAPSALEPHGAALSPMGAGLKAAFSTEQWPSVWFGAGKAYQSKDWSNYGGLVLTVRNPNAAPMQIFVRVDDDEKADGQTHCRTGNATLASGETATLVFPLSVTSPGMNAGPPLVPVADSPKALTIYGPALNEKNIVAFQIFLAQPKQAQTLEIQSVRFVPKPDLNGIVDYYGQYAKADWPGKVHGEDEFKKRAEEEKAWLVAHPPLPGRDEYGGWANGPTLKATGFFRTALVDAANKELPMPKQGTALLTGTRWWLVTPTGHLFWSAGADCVRPYAEGKINGRETMFQYLSDDWKKRGQTDFYQSNLWRKYGENWNTAWVDSDVARMKSWGFNTVGNWSDTGIWKSKKVAYTVPLYVNGLPPLAAKPGSGSGLPDYFDERFPELARGSCLDQTKELKADPWCLGYFMDNELAWDSWAQMGTGGLYVAAREAIMAPPTLAARRAFVKILQAKYKTPADWGKAWNVTVTDWDSPVTIEANGLNEAAKADCSAFSTALAERYFSTMRTAIKEAAPNQLYLGCRFAMRPKEMVDVAAKYCDVVSFNIYEDTVSPETWGFTNSLSKPVLIGEFHFGALDRGMFSAGLRSRPNQKERAQAYADYVRSVRALPAFVGCHWFQWIDEPLTGRFDAENYNIGFVSVTDTPYPEMVQAARQIHSTLYPPAKVGMKTAKK